MSDLAEGFAIWLLRTFCRCKDNRLAHRLHALADTYDTRPTGQWVCGARAL